MGLFSKNSGKPATKTLPKQMSVERANKWMMKIIQTNEHSRAFEGLLTEMNDMPNILPKQVGETQDHLRARKTSAIAMAINTIHEQHGPKTLINEQDMRHALDLINAELMMMDIDKQGAQRRATVIDHAATLKIQKRAKAQIAPQTTTTKHTDAVTKEPSSEQRLAL